MQNVTEKYFVPHSFKEFFENVSIHTVINFVKKNNNFCNHYSARRYASTVLAVSVCLSVRLSVRPSVCHTPVLCQKG